MPSGVQRKRIWSVCGLVGWLCACGLVDDEGGGPRLEASGVVRCEDSSLRAKLGPMEAVELGEGWYEQALQDEVDPFVYGFGLALGDIDGDGWTDIIVVHQTRPQVWMGSPGSVWTEESDRIERPEEVEGYDKWSTNLASLVDIDGDGDLDLYLAFEKIPDQLYFNDGEGYFDNRTADAGLSADVWGTRAIAWGDLDGDLDLDLVLGANGPEDEDFGDPNSILLNDGSGRFEDVSALLTEDQRVGYTQQIGVMDYDLDGHQDIYIVNHRPEYGGNIMLFNDGELSLCPDEAAGTQLKIRGMGLGIGDLNHDGLPDLLLADTAAVRLLVSDLPRSWAESAAAYGLSLDFDDGQYSAWSTQLEDLDNDGLLDAAAVFGPERQDLDAGIRLAQPDELWIQQSGGGFRAMAQEWGLDDTGLGRSLALADLNQDGHLDWLINPRQDSAKAWLSRCGDNSWLTVQLRDQAPNTHGIGSRIEVEAGGQVFRRWLSAGSTGMAISNSTDVHIGLGQNSVIDRLTVTWPDGEMDSWEDIEASQRVRISR